MTKVSMIGKKFGKLTVVSLLERKKKPNGGTTYVYKCSCECGKEVARVGDALTKGAKVNANSSCGCANIQMLDDSSQILVNKSGSSLIKSHINSLDKRLGNRQFLTEELTRTLSDNLKTFKLPVHKPSISVKAIKTSRTIVAHMSDTHFGCNIEKSEVEINEFNWTIAGRRTALFAEQIVNYKPQHRKETDLVLCINGDIIAGVIHDQEWFSDLLTIQYLGTIQILTQAIGYLAQNFTKVSVQFAPGNHGRAMHKSSKSRALTHKWDSYETMIFLGIKQIIEAKYPNVEAKVPSSPYNVFTAQGHNFLMTHGDTFINVGNPGKSINIKGINEQINKLNSSEIGNNNKFAAVIVGHVHTPTVQMLESGTFLIINGCLSGTDPFAQGIGIFSSNPSQQLFEVTKEHPVGDIRFIEVKTADNNSKYDSIIKPFSGKLN